ncbi:type III-B CRISPR module RAMP protein Cmr1 [Oscillatoria sp. FACHB-1406]|uniref:type III-B CRISPR module RAMP protein Cmr1 n=1 Tax=Oscillatoria sp. FACHB-1406 TaxID=2692846 RepID=UPI001683A10F|nr:type III-B CRISPR module RAMP protein Cmr1 [Oscillatoria sp. FACHB-1406]MBD2578559.1 type III-B CRISPR module RAMP protein Cmr1 [Oscillatoria sp. FACHB-1406]
MEINIKTLTPLWTGGVETGKCDRIHETGILGSLRWWMEVLVRGLGGQVNDPTSESRSGLDPYKFDAQKYRKLQDEAERRQYLRHAGLCDVSQIFGATGWKRRFRLEIEETQVVNATIKHPIRANRTYYTDKQSKQKTPTWYFPEPPNTPKTGIFTLRIHSLNPDFKPEIIGGLIQFIADYSALGARPQMGFGVIEIEERINTQPLCDWLFSIDGSNIYPDLPSLSNIFLAQIQPKDSNPSFSEQDTFNLKYDLRNCFRAEEEIRTEENRIQVKTESKSLILNKDKKDRSISEVDGNKDLRHFIMGAVNGDRIAAKVKISRPYKNDKLMRIWGWVPEEADVYKNGWNREKVIDAIYQHLKENYTLHGWREMNSERDTVTANHTDVRGFLRSLLQLQEDE